MAGNFAAAVDILTAGAFLEQAIHPDVTPDAPSMARVIGQAAVQVQNAASYWTQDGMPAQASRASAVADQLSLWTANPPDRQSLYAYQNSAMDAIYRDAATSAEGIPGWGWWSIALGIVGLVGIGIGIHDWVHR